jgi:hypothetical protein
MYDCQKAQSNFWCFQFTVYILTWGELNAICWLAENCIIIIDVTDNI